MQILSEREEFLVGDWSAKEVQILSEIEYLLAMVDEREVMVSGEWERGDACWNLKVTPMSFEREISDDFEWEVVSEQQKRKWEWWECLSEREVMEKNEILEMSDEWWEFYGDYIFFFWQKYFLF